MADKEFRSGYSKTVRITCIVLAALTVLGGLVGTLVYVLAHF